MRLIDADALIDKYGDWYTEEGTEGGYIGTIKGIVDSMPTIEPEPNWIPFGDRLPEKYGNYLVTTDDGEVDIGSCDPENKDRQDHFWSGCDADGFFWYGENIVIAWMPLPKSYMKGEQDEID